MGKAARARGSFEDRVKQAQERKQTEAEARAEVIRNRPEVRRKQTSGLGVLAAMLAASMLHGDIEIPPRADQ